MSFNDVLAATNISASGLSAERLRMEVVANNIANAFTTRTAEGGPYRRKDVVFAAVMADQLGAGQHNSELQGVKVVEIVDHPSELPIVFKPGHPDANAEGFVRMPNVQLPIEMVNLITANRAYEANLKVLRAFQEQAEQALALGRL